MKVLKFFRNLLVWLFVIIAVGMIIFTIVSVSTFTRTDRSLFGYKAFIVLSDSMKKTDFDAGDIVLVKNVDPATLQSGDIIAFTSQNSASYGATVTHKTQRGWEQPKMANCHATGIDITAVGNVQIGGFMPWPGAHTIAQNCSASGKIDATGVSAAGYAGGFFGNLGWNCDLGHMGHQITNCTADVDIVTKDAPVGGFVGTATNSNNYSMYATFKDCKALGDVTCVEGGTASIGGFAGVADRGYYENCSASGTVSGGTMNGGFIGTVKHIDTTYDFRYPVGTRSYEVEQITVVSCTGTADLELIGRDDQSNKDSLKRYHEIIIK